MEKTQNLATESFYIFFFFVFGMRRGKKKRWSRDKGARCAGFSGRDEVRRSVRFKWRIFANLHVRDGKAAGGGGSKIPKTQSYSPSV